MKDNKLQLILVPFGLGKFYTYFREGVRYRIIEMNREMFDFNKVLFYWVLQHELNHAKFYKNPANERKYDKASEDIQKEDRKINKRMKRELFKFQLKYPNSVLQYFFSSMKRFAVEEDIKLLNQNLIQYHECEPLSTKDEYDLRFYMEGL